MFFHMIDFFFFRIEKAPLMDETSTEAVISILKEKRFD